MNPTLFITAAALALLSGRLQSRWLLVIAAAVMFAATR